MQSVLFFALVAASTMASPFSRRDSITGCQPGKSCTQVKVYDSQMNWGSTKPSDAIGAINKPGGICDSDLSCSTDHMKSVSTQIGDDVFNVNPAHQEFVDVSVSESQYTNNSIRDNLVILLQAALSTGTNATNYTWTAQPDLFTSGKAKRDDTGSGTVAQYWQTNQIEVQQQDANGDLMGFIHMNIAISPPQSGFCKAFDPIAGAVSGVAAALTVADPGFAVVSGAFGIISALCTSGS